MKKIKEFSKKYLIGSFISLIIFTIVGVSAAAVFPSNQTAYSNGTTGMSATNVQAAIDELYNTCFPSAAGEQIIENAGLEKDPYECRYFFTGANPNNYITFNGENAGWRIISVECDGTIKIMKNGVGSNMPWDSLDDNDWTRPASLNTYLNETYYNGLNSTAKSQIVAHDWSIGAVTAYNNDLADQINDENSEKWNGKIALPTVSEFLRTNSNMSCNTLQTYNVNDNTCSNNTWMTADNIDYWWFLTKGFNVFDMYFGGVNDYSNPSENRVVRNTVYLSSELQIIGGDGSQSNPYMIKIK